MTEIGLVTLLLLLIQPLHAIQDTEIRDGVVYQWTDWMDDEGGNPLNPASQGDFELLFSLRFTYQFCNPVKDIQCRLASDEHTPFNETGQQGLICHVDTGFVCFHSSQPMSDCFNYEIRVLCPKTDAPTTTEATTLGQTLNTSTYETTTAAQSSESATSPEQTPKTTDSTGTYETTTDAQSTESATSPEQTPKTTDSTGTYETTTDAQSTTEETPLTTTTCNTRPEEVSGSSTAVSTQPPTEKPSVNERCCCCSCYPC